MTDGVRSAPRIARRRRGPRHALAALVLAYPLAAVVGGAVPVNRGYAPPVAGEPLWVCSNGIHADLVLPATGGAVDWAGLLPRAAFRIPPAPADYIAFGWGDRTFYLETQHWSDLRPGTAVAALFGDGPTVMHLQARTSPDGDPGCRRILAEPKRAAMVADYVLAAMARDRDGRPVPLLQAGYGLHDGFVAAVGHYSAFLTCNEWVRRGLGQAGIRAPLWSPFPYALLWQADGLGG